MPKKSLFEIAQSALEQLGIRLAPPGFPHILPGASGQDITVWLDEPALLRHLPVHETGIAVFDSLGNPVGSWGIARNLLAKQDPAVRDLVQKAITKGHASLTLGHSYFTASFQDDHVCVLVLTIDELSEAYLALRNAEKEVNALRRIGKSLAMNQTLQPLAMMTAHAIVGALDLAAVMLWTDHDENKELELVAYSGIDRVGTQRLRHLRTDTVPAFLGEEVIRTGQPVWINRADQHPLTLEVEALHCYLTAGAIAALPLRSAQEVIGVLELVAKDDDQDFLDSKELHKTIAEHLALALNSAILFEKVETLATVDPLTGIANHRTMQEFMAKSVEDAKRDSRPVGVVMIDVDHFRQFNEEEGHDSGDEVLRMVAQVLRSNMRNQDLAARYGGEEFTLILPGMDARSTTAVAERVRLEISRIDYQNKSGQSRAVTASLGCAVYPDCGDQPAELLKSADIALYDAKRNGRNQVVLANPPQDKPKAS